MSGGHASTAASDLGEREPGGTVGADGALGDEGVAAFVRTALDVRRNVVKVWRPLPRGLWTVLATPEDVLRSKLRERQAATLIAAMATALVAVVSGVGYREDVGGGLFEFPLIGGANAAGNPSAASGWYFDPGQTLAACLWVVGPALAGWLLVRVVWIPRCATESSTRAATLAFARHLSGVYLYVFAMVFVGALLLPVLMAFGAGRTATLRWCLWCFLFGESFFVPTLMWCRLVTNDAQGVVFGRWRYAALGAYVLLFVIVPIVGMAVENSRG